MKATPTTYTWQEILERDAEACERLIGQGERHANACTHRENHLRAIARGDDCPYRKPSTSD